MLPFLLISPALTSQTLQVSARTAFYKVNPVMASLYFPDQTNLTVTLDCQRARTESNKQAWLELQSPSHDHQGDYMTSPTNQDSPLRHQATSPMKEDKMATFNCLGQALRWCSAGKDSSLPPPSPEAKASTDFPLVEVSEATHVQVLITGSLHLVGAAMNILGCSVDEL